MLRKRSSPRKRTKVGGGGIRSPPSNANGFNSVTLKIKKDWHPETGERIKLFVGLIVVVVVCLVVLASLRRGGWMGGSHSLRVRVDNPLSRVKEDGQSATKDTFLLPELNAGEVRNLQWSDGSEVQDYAARVGLPPTLVPTLTKYAEDMGLMDIMLQRPYGARFKSGGVEWHEFTSPYQTEGGEEVRTFTWEVKKPLSEKGTHWHSDAHWFNTADEAAHEDALHALAKGGFDAVLEGMGPHFELDELHIDSVGFFSMTKNDGEYWHSDFTNVEGGGFGILIEILPGSAPGKDHGIDLMIEGDNGLVGKVGYSPTVGLIIGDGTQHATAICDHRPHHGTRVTAIIYLNELTEDNLPMLSGDSTSNWPPLDLQADWMWAQRGRHWRRDGGPGLLRDRGRAALEAPDQGQCSREDCADEEREEDRYRCKRTCNLILDDTEYKLGMKRSALFGY